MYGLSTGLIHLEEMSNKTKIRLSYGALAFGASPFPVAIDLSTQEMDCIGGIYPNPIYGKEVLTLNDITGWCFIYQGVFVSGVRPGGYVTHMLLSMGEGLVMSIGATLLTGGIGTLAVPPLMVRSCRAVVVMAGIQ